MWSVYCLFGMLCLSAWRVVLQAVSFGPYCMWLLFLLLSPPPKSGGGVQQPFLRTPADGIPHLAGIRPAGRLVAPPFNQQVPHLHGSPPQICDL